MMPPLTKALVDAGALGTIQSATPPSPIQPESNSEPPLSILDGFVASWDTLPVLPDIKLLNTQFNEIKALVEKKEPVVLEFDIRNWFKMGPVKYHNVVATLRGTTYPDEFIVIGGHFDAFTGGTGGVDDGSGFAPGDGGDPPHRGVRREAEALDRLHRLRGGRAGPRRVAGLAEEAPRAAREDRDDDQPRRQPERDHRRHACPRRWYADFQAITAPLASAQPEVALHARSRRAAGARHEPGRHRLVVVRDAEHPDAQLRDDGREARPGREGDSLVSLSLRVAYD